MAKRIKKQTVEELKEITPVFDKDRFPDNEELEIEWDGGYVEPEPTPEIVEPEVEEDDTQEALPVSVFLPVEKLQVRTKAHASVFNSANRDDRAHNIHLSVPEDFVVYAHAVKDKYSRTRFYQVAEGPLDNLYLDISDIFSTINLD